METLRMDQQGGANPEEEEEQMFQPLCERLLCALSLLQTSLSEMLDLKDELLSHALPSSLTARLSIAAGRLFRSVSDLSVPSMELVRLVLLHSTPWEQKKWILEKLHSDYERKQNYLSVALRRLQLLEAQSRSVARYQRIGNWERLFARLMSAQGVGRRWKLRVEALRTALAGEEPGLGPESFQQPREGDITRQHQESEDDSAPSEKDSPKTALSDRWGPASEENEEKPRGGSGDSCSSSRSPTSEDRDPPLFIETHEMDTQTEVRTEEKETWTREPMTHRFLCVSVSPLLGGSGKGVSCRLTYGLQTRHVQLPAMPAPRPPRPLPITKQVSIQERGSVLSARKAPTGTLHRDSPPGILRRGPVSPQRETLLEAEGTVVSSRSEEVQFDLPATSTEHDTDRLLQLALYHEAEGITATGELSVPRDVSEVLVMRVPLLATGSSPRSPQASLGLTLHSREEVLPHRRDQCTQAWSLEEVVLEATGIDLQLMSPEVLQRLQDPSPDVLEAATSPLPLPAEPQCQDNSTSPMPVWSREVDNVSDPAADYQGECLMQEVVGGMTSLQRIPERPLQMLLDSLTTSSSASEVAELLQQLSGSLADSEGQEDAAGKRDWAEDLPEPELHPELNRSMGERARSCRQRAHRKDVSQTLLLRRALPKDVWQRMQQLEDIMKKNKQNTLEKLRSASSENIERQLSSQRRIQLPSEQDASYQDDVCLPALFMPTRLGHLFTPKAHLYFHASGSGSTLRLTQPPSVLSLPPLSGNNKLSVLNLLDPGVSLPSQPGQRRSGRNAVGASAEGKDPLSTQGKEAKEPAKVIGDTLEAKGSLSTLGMDTGEKLKGRDLTENNVGDAPEGSLPTLGKHSEETQEGRELLVGVIRDTQEVKELLATPRKDTG